MIPSTISYPAGEIVLVDFPLTTSGPGKPRPALVLLDTGDADLVLARITTQHHNPAYDVLLAGWQRAGLLAPSIVRLHKVATLLKSRTQRRLGVLDHTDRQAVAGVLRQMAVAW